MDSKHTCRGLENSGLTGQKGAGGKGAQPALQGMEHSPNLALVPHRFWWPWAASSLAAEKLCPVRRLADTCCSSLDLVSSSVKGRVDLHDGYDAL